MVEKSGAVSLIGATHIFTCESVGQAGRVKQVVATHLDIPLRVGVRKAADLSGDAGTTKSSDSK